MAMFSFAERRSSISSLPNTAFTRQGLLALFMCYVFFTVLLAVSSLSEHFRNRGLWQSWEPSGDMHFWCEQDRVDNFVREPSNAWSDFSFLFVGLVMLYFGISDMFFQAPLSSKNMLMDHPILSFLSGTVNIIHAIGTFTNHACRCWPGYQMDVTGMYLVLMFPSLINFLHIHRNKQRKNESSPPQTPASPATPSLTSTSTSTSTTAIIIGVLCYLGFAFLLFLSTYIVEDPGLIVVMKVAAITFTFLYRWRHECDVPRHSSLLVACLGFLLLGYGMWLADRLRVVCSPTSVVQLHAIWHVSTAISLLTLYLHQRSEGFIYLKSLFLDQKFHFG